MNQHSDNIVNVIRNHIKEKYYDGTDEELTNDLGLISTGIIDSISTLQVVEFLENTFDFEFEPHEVEHDNLDTINKMVEFVTMKKS